MNKTNLLFAIAFAGTALLLNCSQIADNPISKSTARCTTCHAVPPASLSHADINQDSLNCDRCHSRITITNNEPILQPDHQNGTIDCFQCHSTPDDTFGHQNTQFHGWCDSCHSSVTIVNGRFSLNADRHHNGYVDFTSYACVSCHDTADMFANGHPQGDTTFNAHTERTVLINCNNCHAGYKITDPPSVVYQLHRNDTANVIVLNAAGTGTVVITPDANGQVDPDVCGARCHGK